MDDPASVAVAGEDAGLVARELGRAFGLGLTTEERGFALLGVDQPDAARVRDLGDDSVELVVFRRPWNGPVEIGKALGAAYRVLAKGGRVVAGERELDRLTNGSVLAYPIRAFVDEEPGAVADDLGESVGRIALGAGVVRAGFKDVTTFDVDEHRGVYETAEAFVEAYGGDERDAGVAEILASTHSRRPIEDVDPWVYATGVKPT